MITVILVSVDGKDAYYIHLPLIGCGYKRTEVQNDDDDRRTD